MNPIRLLAIASLLFAFDASAERREFNLSVDVHVDNAGAVTKADITAELSPEFEAAVVKMIRGWKFQPGSRNGVPAAVDTTLFTKVIVDIEEGKSATIVARYTGHGPRYLKIVPPGYPSSAMRRRHQGEVVIEATVTADGSTEALKVHSARVKGGKTAAKVLAEAATKAIEQWQFQAERIDGIAVGGKVLLPVKYSLDGALPSDLEMVIAPPTDAKDQTAAIQTATEGERALALENSTGLELVSDGSSG